MGCEIMSEFSEYKKKRQELIDAKKGDNIKEGAGEVILPQTSKEKWDNYWYHYKVHTIVAVFFVFVLIVTIVNFALKTEPDLSIAVASAKSFEGSTAIFNDGLKPYAGDNNGDGKVMVETRIIFLNSEGKDSDPEVLMANQAMLMGWVQDSTHILYIVDEANYQDIIEMGGAFKDLTAIAPEGAKLVDKIKFELKGTKLAKELQMEDSLKDMYLCIIDGDEFEGALKENYDYCVEVAKQMMAN